MKFVILIHEPQSEFDKRTNPEQAATYWPAWAAYSEAVAKAGIFVGGAGLELPSNASTLRVRDGRRTIEDGPYADTREMLGGFYIIDVPSLDEALEWAARCPAAPFGSIEVRPVLSMGE